MDVGYFTHDHLSLTPVSNQLQVDLLLYIELVTHGSGGQSPFSIRWTVSKFVTNLIKKYKVALPNHAYQTRRYYENISVVGGAFRVTECRIQSLPKF